MTENTIANRKMTKRQRMGEKALHKKNLITRTPI